MPDDFIVLNSTSIALLVHPCLALRSDCLPSAKHDVFHLETCEYWGWDEYEVPTTNTWIYHVSGQPCPLSFADHLPLF